MIRETGDTYTGIRDWGPDIERITRAGQVLADYQRAIGALSADDRETAINLLVTIIATNPRYKNAVWVLHEALNGPFIAKSEAQTGKRNDITPNQRSTQDQKSKRPFMAVTAIACVQAIVIGAFAKSTLQRPSSNQNSATSDAGADGDATHASTDATQAQPTPPQLDLPPSQSSAPLMSSGPVQSAAASASPIKAPVVAQRCKDVGENCAAAKCCLDLVCVNKTCKKCKRHGATCSVRAECCRGTCVDGTCQDNCGCGPGDLMCAMKCSAY